MRARERDRERQMEGEVTRATVTVNTPSARSTLPILRKSVSHSSTLVFSSNYELKGTGRSFPSRLGKK